jgi:catechol 2,3-dioxygenase-like lactoylglutathione lyase family enzyme
VPAIEIEGPIRSLYCRDPDGNLIELANREAKNAKHG